MVVHDGTEKERIVIRVFGQERYYLRDLPIHHSQQEIAQYDDYSDFELSLRPTIDFTRHLLSMGNTVKILSPTWLAEQLRKMHLDAVGKSR